mmetsp:Transcript_34850/g.66547  ORF Transcript_34850/g.66547 Transcript_34850/m.66547 type:complete len:204 (-) Transcript_34850:1090-1701(-)
MLDRKLLAQANPMMLWEEAVKELTRRYLLTFCWSRFKSLRSSSGASLYLYKNTFPPLANTRKRSRYIKHAAFTSVLKGLLGLLSMGLLALSTCVIVNAGSALPAFQRYAARSAPAVSTQAPSWLQAIEFNAPAWAMRSVPSPAWRDSGSRSTRAVLSTEALANRVPSGEYASWTMAPLCTASPPASAFFAWKLTGGSESSWYA